ncbi:MAG: NUDIX domain-containing protein [Cyclobacteriaceae bacterium]|nr:NUDIX domain-containing protein [Cyclobacteriaceae bacterium]
MEEYLIAKYGNRVRVRVCGIFVKNNSLLLVKHTGLGDRGVFWAPPGGEVEFGESIKLNLQREMLEETGLEVEVGEFICTHEFLKPPLHAIELFFHIKLAKGKVITGIDPELTTSEQIIKEVRYVTFEELEIIPNEQKHHLLQNVCGVEDFFNISSFVEKN